MQRDVALLQKLKIMDYSMLVGIHDLERGNEEQLRDKTLKVFQPGGDNTEDQNPPAMGALARTPSKLETAKRAKELREMVKNEKPVSMDQMLDKMPQGAHRKDFYFYADDGGFQATHENDLPGEEIYYLGIIDCLTRVSRFISLPVSNFTDRLYSTTLLRKSSTSGKVWEVMSLKSHRFLLRDTATAS